MIGWSVNGQPKALAECRAELEMRRLGPITRQFKPKWTFVAMKIHLMRKLSIIDRNRMFFDALWICTWFCRSCEAPETGAQP